jgi:hypothetical protein
MEVQLDDNVQRLYSRLYVSGLDLASAEYCLGVLMKKGWHYLPWDKRGSIYEQQSAFTSALVVAYARPFNTSYGWPKFPVELIPFDEDEQVLHELIISLRNSVFAHSDSKSYSVRPWRAKGFATDIIGRPALRITAEQGRSLSIMIQKLQKSIQTRLMELVPE